MRRRPAGVRGGQLVAALAVFGAADAAFAQTSFTGLGHLPGASTLVSIGYGISADGSVVTGYSSSAEGSQAFRWEGGTGMVGLGDLAGGGFDSRGMGASADGTFIAGTGEAASGDRGVRWEEAGTPSSIEIGDLPGGSDRSSASGISNDGQVVVGTSSATAGSLAVRWTATGGLESLGELPGGIVSSGASAASADGSVIVGSSHTEGGTHAFRWDAQNGMVDLGTLFLFDQGDSSASAVTPDGSIVVGKSSPPGAARAFRWDAQNEMVALPDLPGGEVFSEAYDVSADGGVIVGRSTGGSGHEAALWTPYGVYSLRQLLVSEGVDMTGWILHYAYAVSDDGLRITGYATRPGGGLEAFLVTLDPSLIGPPQVPTTGPLAVGLLVALLLAAAWSSVRRPPRAGTGDTAALRSVIGGLHACTGLKCSISKGFP